MNRFALSRHLGLLAGLLLSAAPAVGQVTLAPTFVYIDSPARYATVMVTNSSESTQEVFVDFQFGYPAADSAGERYIEYDDSVAAASYSLSESVRSFPQRFRIAPKHRQLVRLMLQTPKDLAEGVYWTRMVVTSHEQVAHEASGNSARVDFEFKQVIPIVFNSGSSKTAVEVTALKIVPYSRHVNLMAVLERQGDVPFFGSIVLRLYDGSGKRVKELTTTAEAYFESSTYFTLERRDVPPGRYVAEIALLSDRSDVRQGDLPAMEPVSRRFAVQIPDVAVTSVQ